MVNKKHLFAYIYGKCNHMSLLSLSCFNKKIMRAPLKIPLIIIFFVPSIHAVSCRIRIPREFFTNFSLLPAKFLQQNFCYPVAIDLAINTLNHLLFKLTL